jgi:hypothetical protein
LGHEFIQKQGSEAGQGSEAKRAPGESGQAQGVGYAERAFQPPDVDHPHSRSKLPEHRGGRGQDPSLPGSVEQQEEAVREDEGA